MPQLVSSLSVQQLVKELSGPEGITLEIGPFWVNIYCKIPDLGQHLKLLYNDYSVIDNDFADFHISLKQPINLHRWLKPQVNFYFDNESPFKPLPLTQTYPFLEWGLNWCIATMAHQYLIIHSAIVAKGEHALILPGKPGAGKSTLCAALINRGWRLLSDEMALVKPNSNIVTPIPRPVSLKNESIEVIQNFAPETIFGPVIKDTHKGTVTHIKPPVTSLQNKAETAQIKWIVFPQFKPGSNLETTEISKAQALIQLAAETFNYGVLGVKGFTTLNTIISNSFITNFQYSNLEEAMTWFDKLSGNNRENPL